MRDKMQNLIRSLVMRNSVFTGDIVIYAFRYALTRNSMAGAIFTDWLLDNIATVSNNDIKLMMREIIEGLQLELITDIDANRWSWFHNKLENELKERVK